MEKRSFTTFEIIKKLGIERECLREWMKRDYIKPTIQTSSGPGTKNLFSRLDLYQIECLRSLISMGLQRGLAAGCADMLSHSSIRLLEKWMNTDRKCKYYNQRHPYPTFIIVTHYTNPKGGVELAKMCIFDETTVKLDENADYEFFIGLNLSLLRKKIDNLFQLKTKDDLKELLIQ